MKYKVGDYLVFLPDSKHKNDEVVTVTHLKKRGCAQLSNGWVVDEDGMSEGTGRVPGGRVREISDFEWWFSCCCVYGSESNLAPMFYVWNLQKPGQWRVLFEDGLTPEQAVDRVFKAVVKHS